MKKIFANHLSDYKLTLVYENKAKIKTQTDLRTGRISKYTLHQ